MKHRFTMQLLALSVLILTACTGVKAMTVNDEVMHSFEFNTYEFDGKGKEDVEILDYLYGNPDGYAYKNPEQYRKLGKCEQGTGGGKRLNITPRT